MTIPRIEDVLATRTDADSPAAASDSAPPPVLRSERGLRITLFVVAGFQFFIGAAFLVVPSQTAALLGLAEAPGWTNWLFAMMAARFLGYGVGLIVAARDPLGNRTWIDTMIAIQLIDWVATVSHLVGGDVTLRQVTTASFVPVLLAGALAWLRPRRSTSGT